MSLSPEFDLHRAVAELAVPAYVVGRDGRFQWLNAACVDLIGDLRGEPFERIVAPEHRAQLARTLVGRDGTVYDLLVIDQAGERARLRVCTVPLRSAGVVVGVFGVAVPLGRTSPARDDSLRAGLTPRQLETLRLLAEGLETKQIAERLGVAEETARNHIRALLRALRVHSRLEAVVTGRRLGLLWPYEPNE